MRIPEAFEIVLVGDIVDEGPLRVTLFDWDNPTWDEVRQIQAWLDLAGIRTQVISPVAAFSAHAAALDGKLVLPLWRGGASRSRTSVVPAICEALGLAWIGADAFAQSVCQDKSLAKHYLRAAEIACPDDVVVRTAPVSPNTIRELSQLALPVVVKPLFSACSIGIDEGSLCQSLGALIVRAEALLQQGLGPVICEPFIAGDEVSVCLAERAGQPVLRCVAAYRTGLGQCSFAERLMTFDDKMAGDRWTIAPFEGAIADDLWAKVDHLLEMLGPTHLLRLDGRVADGHFTAIELTPDIHLGLDSAFLGGFNAVGVPPWQVLHEIADAARASGRGSQSTRPAAASAGVGLV